MKDLDEAKIVDVDEEDDTGTILNAAMITAYYKISFTRLKTSQISFTSHTKLTGILDIVTSATEFDLFKSAGMRAGYQLLQRPSKDVQPNSESPHFNALRLL